MQTETHQEFEQQQRYGAIIRSLSGDVSAQIRDWQLFYKDMPHGDLAPHLRLENLTAPWASPRGIVDGIALRFKDSDSNLYYAHSPEGLVESLVFEVLEQIRVESICPESLKGSRHNIQTQFIAWLEQFIATGGAEGSIGLLLISVFSTVWMRLNGQAIPQLMQDIVEATRAGMAQEMGPLLAQLKAQQHHQLAYTPIALGVVSLVSNLIDAEYRHNPSIRTKRKQVTSSILKIEWVPPSATKTTPELISSALSPHDKRDQLNQHLNRYHIFDTTYDTEQEAKKKIRPAQLAIYQAELNQAIAEQAIPWAKLTRVYQQLFSSNIPQQWQTTETEGQIDRRHLIRAATAPLQPMLYRQRYESPKAQAKFTLLVDCSGSMKEQRLNMAVCIDSMVKILEQAGIQTEVLGYSTNSWQGGRPFKAWRKNGQAPNPGRLNERAHWIFKDFKTSWRRSRAGIAALLRPEIYAESIDGEALLWAAERLLNSSHTRPINAKLILFSDGCPMDRATLEANGEDFLKDHLLQAMAWCEQQPHLELWGCGIGNELRPAFSKRLSWDPATETIGTHLSNWAKEFKSKSLGH